jgi:galactofuranose transport system substrate-binding protein
MVGRTGRHGRQSLGVVVTGLALIAATWVSAGAQSPSAAPGNTFGCPPIPKKDAYTVGWSQISNNNAFRLTETDSIVKEAAARGYTLIQTDANDDTAKQLNDVEDLLSQGIDILALPPREFEASAPALAAAKEKGVPVFLVDRSAKGTAGTDYVTVMSSNFIKQGNMAADWLVAKTGGNAKIVELTGTPGASASIERSQGFHDGIANQPGMTMIAQQSANFDQATAQQVMEQIIQSTGGDIDVVYTSADVMALGAIAALEAAGIQVGGDGGVIVTGMDGNKAALQSIFDGKLSMSVETNPRFGPLLFDTIESYLACQPIPAYVQVNDRVFDAGNVDQAAIDNAF